MADRNPAEQAAEPSTVAVAPGEEPWTPDELAEQRRVLGAELSRIESEVASLQSALSDVLRDGGDGAGDDQADTGAKAFERDQEMTLLANTRESLFQTERALQRIMDGTYGTCESCGEGIGKMRLQAFPRATLCVSCKQRQERR
ncbi:MAG TPA: TraR/DksA C4-type zinc finger protein [Kineosporiaceae bacterium]|nr:TraR/DksA C4-type zinc finger protein [Kineosporiaceae bacterium]